MRKSKTSLPYIWKRLENAGAVASISLAKITGTTKETISSETFILIAEEAALHSKGKLRIAFHEEDATTEVQPEAAHFLKINEERLGRDLELYGAIMARMSPERALISFLEEIILPMKTEVPESYSKAGALLKKLGLKVYEPKLQKEWCALFN